MKPLITSGSLLLAALLLALVKSELSENLELLFTKDGVSFLKGKCPPNGYNCLDERSYIHCDSLVPGLVTQEGVPKVCGEDEVCNQQSYQPCQPRNTEPLSGNIAVRFRSFDSTDQQKSKKGETQKGKVEYPYWKPTPIGEDLPCRKTGLMMGTFCSAFSTCFGSARGANGLVKSKQQNCKGGKHFNPYTQTCIPYSESLCIQN